MLLPEKNQIINQEKPRTFSGSLKWIVNYQWSATLFIDLMGLHANKPNSMKGTAPISSFTSKA